MHSERISAVEGALAMPTSHGHYPNGRADDASLNPYLSEVYMIRAKEPFLIYSFVTIQRF